MSNQRMQDNQAGLQHDCGKRELLYLMMICLNIAQLSISSTFAQSIGYQPNLFFGFNPYTSPVYGYGLGYPYGTYGISPLRYTYLTAYNSGSNLASKIHAKSIWKKLSASPYYYGGSLKDKLYLLKNPEYATTPVGSPYGYGKHYGAALVPNNPYKSTYGDYYTESNEHTSHQPHYQYHHQESNILIPPNKLTPETSMIKTYSILKPLVKIGALLTTAALIGKKIPDIPAKLDPHGMIGDGTKIL